MRASKKRGLKARPDFSKTAQHTNLQGNYPGQSPHSAQRIFLSPHIALIAIRHRVEKRFSAAKAVTPNSLRLMRRVVRPRHPLNALSYSRESPLKAPRHNQPRLSRQFQSVIYVEAHISFAKGTETKKVFHYRRNMVNKSKLRRGIDTALLGKHQPPPLSSRKQTSLCLKR